MQTIRKSFFTLMELLVVVFILSLVVTVTGIKLKGAYDEQRFLSESQEVLSTLMLAQDLMLIMDTDVLFHLAYNDKSSMYECWLDVEKPLSKEWNRLAERKISLPAIRSFAFDNHTSSPLLLLFSLGKMSKGELIFYPDEKKKKEDAFIIRLPGYPSTIIRKIREDNKADEERSSEHLYPNELYDEIHN